MLSQRRRHWANIDPTSVIPLTPCIPIKRATLARCCFGVVTAIFCFAYLKVNETKDRMLTDIFEFSTPKLCKNKRKK